MVDSKIAREIAETLYKLMTPEPTTNAASVDRTPCMAIHAGSMEAAISMKLEPLRDILMRAHTAESPEDMWEDVGKALAMFEKEH